MIAVALTEIIEGGTETPGIAAAAGDRERLLVELE
jgi:hypothetical protein